MSKKRKVGLSPGSLIYTGEEKNFNSSSRTIIYNKDILQIKEFLDLNPIVDTKTWIDHYGIHDSQIIQKIGQRYNIHNLVLENIMDISNRVKLEIYENGIFCVFQHIKLKDDHNELKTEQVSFYFARDFLLSFQEDPDDSFAIIRKRMSVDTSRIRKKSTDYLFYAIVDYMVDNYFELVDQISEEINELENRIHRELDEELVVEIYSMRTKLIKLRNFIYPLKDELNKIKNSETDFIETDTLIFLRDLEDHLIQLIEMLDNQRELLNGMKDLIYSQSSLKMNKDIKWLTVLSTISIPIVLLTGIYGMNFRHMPELEWQYGYLIWWMVTVLTIFSLIVVFKRKKLF